MSLGWEGLICVKVLKRDNRENGKKVIFKENRMFENFLELLKDIKLRKSICKKIYYIKIVE